MQRLFHISFIFVEFVLKNNGVFKSLILLAFNQGKGKKQEKKKEEKKGQEKGEKKEKEKVAEKKPEAKGAEEEEEEPMEKERPDPFNKFPKRYC